MAEFVLYSNEEREAYEALPETIEWRAYQKRASSNARPHCVGCGRFMKKSTVTQHGDYPPEGYCANCDDWLEAIWEKA